MQALIARTKPSDRTKAPPMQGLTALGYDLIEGLELMGWGTGHSVDGGLTFTEIMAMDYGLHESATETGLLAEAWD